MEQGAVSEFGDQKSEIGDQKSEGEGQRAGSTEDGAGSVEQRAEKLSNCGLRIGAEARSMKQSAKCKVQGAKRKASCLAYTPLASLSDCEPSLNAN